MQSNTCQHGGDSWNKKCILWVVITMDRCMRDFWSWEHVPETWHSLLFAPGLASSREWEESKLLPLVSQCAQFQIHQKPRYTRETFINHTRAAVRQETDHIYGMLKEKMGKVRFTLRTVKGKTWKSPNLLKIRLPVIFLILINYLLISTLFYTKGRSWASFLLDIVLSSV